MFQRGSPDDGPDLQALGLDYRYSNRHAKRDSQNLTTIATGVEHRQPRGRADGGFSFDSPVRRGCAGVYSLGAIAETAGSIYTRCSPHPATVVVELCRREPRARGGEEACAGFPALIF